MPHSQEQIIDNVQLYKGPETGEPSFRIYDSVLEGRFEIVKGPLFNNATTLPYGKDADVYSPPVTEIYEAVDWDNKNDQTVAVKTFKPNSEGLRQDVQRELTAHALLSGNQGIVEVEYVGPVNEGPVPQHVLITRMAEGTVLDYINNIEDTQRQKVALQIASKILPGLVVMHDIGLVHKDIKAANILRQKNGQQMDYFLTDFGLIRATEARLKALTDPREIKLWTALKAQGVTGSLNYIAPELINDPDLVTPAIDIYSLGSTLYRVLTGQKPFVSRTFTEYAREVNYGVAFRPNQLNFSVSHEVSELIMDCLSVDPVKRPSSQTVLKRVEELQVNLE